MFDIVKFLKDAPAGQVVCPETKATKNMVLNAIMDGAKTADDVMKSVDICGKPGCGCRRNVEALLEAYLPVYDIIYAGGGCHCHEKK
ncbi:MAG: hypothetical protein Q4F74_05660 [Synergistaceae bacterium]|nr:hypothetical protein [Synergistaceae bacterium]